MFSLSHLTPGGMRMKFALGSLLITILFVAIFVPAKCSQHRREEPFMLRKL